MQDQHTVWERIAASFDRSRRRTWAHVVAFLDRLAPDARVLDLMCGNGRHIGPALARELDVVALDWSRPLCRIVAARHGVPVVVGEATRLPFGDATFDACVYVAGLHGLPTGEARLASLRELRRVLRPSGQAQITVWSRDAPRFRFQGAPGEPIDVVLPWRGDGHDEQRAYHLYSLAALQRDVEAAGLRAASMQEVSILSDEPDNLVVEVTH